MNIFDNVARTQWFPLWPYAERNTEGLMPGVYEVDYDYCIGLKYSYFDGNYWYQASTTPKGALSHRVNNVRTRAIFLAFRGLAENPNKSSTEIVAEPWVDPKLEHLKDVLDGLERYEQYIGTHQQWTINEAAQIISELIQSIESTYETVA